MWWGGGGCFSGCTGHDTELCAIYGNLVLSKVMGAFWERLSMIWILVFGGSFFPKP